MRFLLDERSDPRLAPYLRRQGHDATIIATDYPAGLADEEVLRIASTEQRILVTNDRDFGELVVVHRQAHVGVIFLRLDSGASLAEKIERLDHVLTHYISVGPVRGCHQGACAGPARGLTAGCRPVWHPARAPERLRHS